MRVNRRRRERIGYKRDDDGDDDLSKYTSYIHTHISQYQFDERRKDGKGVLKDLFILIFKFS